MRYFILIFALMLICACTKSSNVVKGLEEMGYWENDKPYMQSGEVIKKTRKGD